MKDIPKKISINIIYYRYKKKFIKNKNNIYLLFSDIIHYKYIYLIYTN